MHADAPRGGLGNGHLLDCVLQVHAGRVQPLGQVGAVHQLERRRPIAGQEALQQLADAVAGVAGIEVLRRSAQGLKVLANRLGLGPLHLALIEDADGLEFSGLGIQGLLGHLDGDRPTFGEHLLGDLDRPGPVFSGQFKRPG